MPHKRSLPQIFVSALNHLARERLVLDSQTVEPQWSDVGRDTETLSVLFDGSGGQPGLQVDSEVDHSKTQILESIKQQTCIPGRNISEQVILVEMVRWLLRLGCQYCSDIMTATIFRICQRAKLRQRVKLHTAFAT